ncbi:hypothetical protein [Rhizobium leguminosarum]|uniref:hypothetical protein n=1 Tax=Rhizobium leguminosarum TaxID=384 RepID=UPI00041B2196|nr:hypothetical protein [Rhizobium leguminosarum]
MLYLDILILIITGVGATYGIWSGDNLNKKKAIISTIITVCGVTATLSLSVWKYLDDRKSAVIAARLRTDELLTTLAATELRNVDVAWTFDNVPPGALQLLDIGDALVDSYFLANEDVDRLPADERRKVDMAERIDTTVEPMLGLIASGTSDPSGLFEGEDIGIALARFKNDPKGWVDGLGTALHYKGGNYELLFPLNPNSDAILSLGKPGDDPVSDEPSAWQQDTNLFAKTNFAFKVGATSAEGSVTLHWIYDRGSLNRAAERPTDGELSGGFGKVFSFLIVHRRLQRTSYLNELTSRLSALPPERAAGGGWADHSTLQISVNGLANPHYVYDVTYAGTHSYAPNRGAYDAPVEEFAYTRFDCRLRALD